MLLVQGLMGLVVAPVGGGIRMHILNVGYRALPDLFLGWASLIGSDRRLIVGTVRIGIHSDGGSSEPVFVGTVTLHGFLRVFPKNIFIIA